MIPHQPILLLAALSFFTISVSSAQDVSKTTSSEHQAATDGWKARLAEILPEFGHRNYIVIADSAYPKQSNPAIETIATDDTQAEILKHVLAAIAKQPHVRGVAMVDAELDHVTEQAAPGIDDYRKTLKSLLKGQTTKKLPHDEIIADLDESAKLFNVLLIKSTMTIPYTSVFIRLECGYWDEAREKALRESLESK